MKYSFDIKATLERLEPMGNTSDTIVSTWYDICVEGQDLEEVEAEAYERILYHHNDNRLGYDIADMEVLSQREVL